MFQLHALRTPHVALLHSPAQVAVVDWYAVHGGHSRPRNCGTVHALHRRRRVLVQCVIPCACPILRVAGVTLGRLWCTDRLVDDPDPAVGYMRAYEQQQSGAVPKHVFPFSYYFKLRGAFTNKVRVIPYRQFIRCVCEFVCLLARSRPPRTRHPPPLTRFRLLVCSCAVAAQQATDQGKPAPARAGPPTERLRVATALLHHKTCELYRYEKPDTQSEFAVSDDVEFQRCAKIDSVSAELRPGEALNATSWLSTVEDQVLVFADVWNRYAQFGYPLPHLAKRHEVVKISDFHMDAVRRFAGFLQKNGHITVPDDTDPLRAVTVFHWRSETVSVRSCAQNRDAVSGGRHIFTPCFLSFHQFGDNHMLLKCAAALGGAARQFLDLLGDSHHKEHGIIMSDLPTRGVMEKWLSYIGKDGREERLLGLPTLKKGASGRLLDYSDHFQGELVVCVRVCVCVCVCVSVSVRLSVCLCVCVSLSLTSFCTHD